MTAVQTPPDTATSTSTATAKMIRFDIKRQDTPSSAPYWEAFDVPYKANLNVISCLQSIAANPVTAEGKQSTPVVWDCSCLEEVCGACTVVINGQARQSCSALVDELLKDTDNGPIKIEPMSKFPVVRDLWVDRQRMFDALIKIKGWVPIDGMHSIGAGPTESPDVQDTRYELSKCMTCGCCLEACPQFTLDNNFIGAQAISQARYFNAHETGKVMQGERLDAMSEAGGISDCGNAQNCVKACPKDIPLTESIAAIGRQVTVHAIKSFFTGR